MDGGQLSLYEANKELCFLFLKPLLALMENQKRMLSFRYRVDMYDGQELSLSQIMGIMQVCNYAINLQKLPEGSQISTQYSHEDYKAETKL